MGLNGIQMTSITINAFFMDCTETCHSQQRTESKAQQMSYFTKYTIEHLLGAEPWLRSQHCKHICFSSLDEGGVIHQSFAGNCVWIILLVKDSKKDLGAQESDLIGPHRWQRGTQEKGDFESDSFF